MSYTKGPWSITKAKHGIPSDNKIIAVVNNYNEDMSLIIHSEDISGNPFDDANLIHAAPELLEALERCLSEMQGGDYCEVGDSSVEQAEKAIAKARGQL